MSNAKPSSTKNQKRDHAREQARIFREEQAKRQRRRRTAWQVGVAAAALVVVAVVVVAIVAANHQNNLAKAAQSAPGPMNMASDGILLTGTGGTITAVHTAAVAAGAKPVATNDSKYSGKANIVEYIDLQCPVCQAFETTNLTQVEKWVGEGKATLEIHPLAFLTEPSNGNYSPEAANAAACVAQYQPDDFPAFVQTMYANQPKEGTGGESTAKLVSVVKGSGATSSSVASCISSDHFGSWVSAATERANESVFGGTVDHVAITTPTVLINGKVYQPQTQAEADTWVTDPKEFASFVDSVVPGTTD